MSDPQTQQMTTTKEAPIERPSIEGIEDALLDGDLSKLTPEQRVTYMQRVCESVGLNPLTKPFRYIRLNGQLTLYATRDAAEQLRKVHGISITDLEESWREDLCVFRAYARDGDGRTDVATGAVDTSRASGQALANAIMKAETKAKRRVTLSLAGLGWLDETEISDIPDEATEEVTVSHESGQIQECKADQWYRQATEYMTSAVREGDAEASDFLRSAGQWPTDHPIDDWPEVYAEALTERLKEVDAEASAEAEDPTYDGASETTYVETAESDDEGDAFAEGTEDSALPF